MASVEFDLLWLHDRGDLDDARAFYVTDGGEDVTGAGAERRGYAGGNTRIVRGATIRLDDLEYELVEVPREPSPATIAESLGDLVWLRSKINVTLLARDPRGRVREGFYTAFRVTEPPKPHPVVGVALRLETVTPILVMSA